MNYTPVSKVGSAGIAGALSVIVIWAISNFTHVIIPPEIASAITTVMSFIAGYFTPITSTNEEPKQP